MLLKRRIIKKRRFKRKVLFATSLGGFLLLVFIGVVSFWFFSLRQGTLVSPLPVLGSDTPLLDMSDEDRLRRILIQKSIRYDTIATASDSAAYIVKLETNEEIWLSPKRDIDEQISSLQLILSRLTMEGREIRRLDMRFDKPVITFKK